jgi:hypothetical protein
MPQDIRNLLLPGARRPAPDEYARGLRIAGKIEQLTDEDRALFERRSGRPSGDYGLLEASVDRFVTRQDRERKTILRVQGTERLHRLVVEFRAAIERGLKPKDYRRWPRYDQMLSELRANKFASVQDYELASYEYLKLFERRALEVTLFSLRASEHAVKAELRRFSETRSQITTFNDFARLRELLDKHERQPRMHEAMDLMDAAKAERARLTPKYPILADPKLEITTLNAPTFMALGEILRQDANDRLGDIETTRDQVLGDNDKIYQLDRVVPTTLQELGAAPGSVHEMIVAARMDKIRNDASWRAMSRAVMAIAFGLVTFGAGTVVVLAASAGSLGLSISMAQEEWSRYSAAEAAAHTAFDTSQSLSSNDPNGIWVALALAGVVADSLLLVSALRAAAPALQELQSSGSVARFEAALGKAKDLTAAQKVAAAKGIEAKNEFWAAFTRARKALNIGAGIGALQALPEVTRMAFYAAKVGVRRFADFIRLLRAQRVFLQGFDVGSLTAEQLTQWEAAFQAGVREFDLTRPTIKVPSARGKSSTLSFRGDGELLLDGKVIGETKRAEVMKRLELTHTDRGHGAARDPVTIANEALLNARNNQAGGGMSAVWRSDEAMIQSLNRARRELAAGRGVAQPGNVTIVQLESAGSEGRVFVANSHLPANARVVSASPFPGLAVTEIVANRIVAIFKNGRLSTIFPAWIP